MGLKFNSHKYSGDLNKPGLQDKPKLRDSWEEYQDDQIKMTENHLVRWPKMLDDCKRKFLF